MQHEETIKAIRSIGAQFVAAKITNNSQSSSVADGTLKEETDRRQTVGSLSIENLMRLFGDKTIDILKIDIEGEPSTNSERNISCRNMLKV